MEQRLRTIRQAGMAGLIMTMAVVGGTLSGMPEQPADAAVVEQAARPADGMRGTIAAFARPVLVTSYIAHWHQAPSRAVRLVYQGHLGHHWGTEV